MIKNMESHWGGELYFDNKRITRSCGRNGAYTSVGVDVYYSPETQKVQLTGITSKGSAASGKLEIPIQDIPELIEILNKLK